MSDVEKFYYAVQKHMGGNRTWSNLNFMEQQQFVQALNIMFSLTSSQGGQE